MALVVEDGTGLANAESFTSVAFADTYHAARGSADWAALTETAKEQALRRATTFLDRAYAYKGLPVMGRDQALAWPRAWVTDRDGYAVESDSVPREIQSACAEVALLEAGTPGIMAPLYTPHERIKSEKVGPLATEFDLSDASAQGARPVLLIVNDLIGALLNYTAGSRLSGEAVRV